MKYFIPFILSVLILSQASGQITITSVDLMDVGDSANLAAVPEVPPGFEPGAPGPNQHWDFSALLMDTNHYLYFVDPATTPYAASFPTSNIAVEGMVDSAWAYTTKNSFVFQIDGLAGSYDIFEDVVAPFEPPEILFSFPVNYLDSLEQTSIIDLTIPSPEPPADSVRLKVVTTVNSKIDAWGELTTPVWVGDVLRYRDLRITIDSSWVKLIGFWIYLESNTTIAINYTYMANDVGYPVLQFDSDTAGSEYSSINYLLDTGVGEPDLYLSDGIIFSIYPNPASTAIYCIMQSADVEGLMSIYDMMGREMDVIQISKGSNQYRVDVSGYPSGLYHLMIKNGNSILGQKKFIVR